MLSENGTDPSMTMPSALYCSFVETMMKTECYTKSILELWDFDMDQIANLTKDDIVNAINTYDRKWVNCFSSVSFLIDYSLFTLNVLCKFQHDIWKTESLRTFIGTNRTQRNWTYHQSWCNRKLLVVVGQFFVHWHGQNRQHGWNWRMGEHIKYTKCEKMYSKKFRLLKKHLNGNYHFWI